MLIQISPSPSAIPENDAHGICGISFSTRGILAVILYSLMSDLATIMVPTSYFLAAVAISAIATWLIQSSRIARQGRQFAAISRENARIAQELHDGLLQGFLGLAWQVEAAAKQ